MNDADHSPTSAPAPQESWLDVLLALGDNRRLLGDLVRQVQSASGVVPFVGAGLSAAYHLPQWGPLLRSLAPDAASIKELDRLLAANEYEAAAEYVFDARGAVQFNQLLARALALEVDVEKDTAITKLGLLPTGPIITTNFDKIIETVLVAEGVPLTVVFGDDRARIIESIQYQTNTLLKVHGDADDPASRVLTRREYDEHYTRWLRQLLRNMATRPMLFLGCSLQSDRPVKVLQEVVKEGQVLVHHFAILALPPAAELEARTRQLTDELRINPIWFPAGRYEFIDRVLDYLVERVPDDRRRNYIASTKPTSRDIPVAPAQLFGREVAELVPLIESSAIVLVHGGRGVGKTAFALQGLRYFMDKPTFDALAWITASARKEALRLSHILDAVSLAIDYPFDVQVREEDKEAILVKQMADRSLTCLLLLDNYDAVTDSEVDAFLFERLPPQLHVLITSTRAIVQPTVASFPLGDLGERDAALMFRERLVRDGLAQESEVAVAALYDAVGGNPLATEWVVGQMRGGRTLRSVVERLSGSTATALREILEVAWDGLDEPARSVLDSIVAFVRPALHEGLVATSGLEADEFESALDRLVMRYLVRPLRMHDDAGLGAGRRYHVHPFLRDFLERRRRPSDAASSFERAAEFHVGYVRRRGGTPELEEADGWCALAAERDNILGVLLGCWSHDRKDAVVPLVQLLARWLFVESHWNDLETWGRRAVEAAISDGEFHRAARILNEVGRTYSYRSQFAQAYAAFDKAREWASTAPKDHWSIAYIGHHQGEALMREKKLAAAKPLLEESLKEFTTLDSTRSMIGVRYRLAMLAFEQADYKQARALARTGVTDCISDEWTRLEGFNHRLLGDIAVKLQQPDEARKQYEAALRLVPSTDMRIQALIELSLARLELADGKVDEASRQAALAVSHFEKLGMAKEAAEARSMIRPPS
ncbi:MAG: SIR2 family protein [Gemmatimonadaceae bacterium]